jgi:hypothetical protein
MKLKLTKPFTFILLFLLCGLLAACDGTNNNKANMTNSTMDVTDKTKTISLSGLGNSGERLKSNMLTIKEAYKKKLDDVFVEDNGEVIKLLKDDTHGSQHQRFIIKTSNGKTVLVAHNIDIADRINSIRIGDTVTFRGEYVFNPKGGILHWTHHDPDGSSVGGWIEHEGKIYK